MGNTSRGRDIAEVKETPLGEVTASFKAPPAVGKAPPTMELEKQADKKGRCKSASNSDDEDSEAMEVEEPVTRMSSRKGSSPGNKENKADNDLAQQGAPVGGSTSVPKTPVLVSVRVQVGVRCWLLTAEIFTIVTSPSKQVYVHHINTFNL